MSLSDTEVSDEEIDYTEEITDIEASFRKVIEGLDACLKGLKKVKKEPRTLVIGTKTLEEIVRASIGPNFGSHVIKSLKGE